MLEHFDIVLSFAVVMLLLSLIVTTVVQIVVVVLRQRYSVLKWGVARLIQQVAPSLSEKDASTIAAAVLCHPAVSRGWTCTTAIRKDELIRLLDDLAKPAVAPDEKQAVVEKRSKFIRWVEEIIRPVRKWERLRKAAGVALNGLVQNGPSPEFGAAVGQLKNDMQNSLGTAIPREAARIRQTVDQIVKQTLEDTRQTVAELGAWFDTVMDRTTDQFLLRTRVTTVVVAALAAFLLHIDSLQILRQLDANPDIRTKLIRNVDATIQRAEDVLALSAAHTAMASAAVQTACAEPTMPAGVRALSPRVPPDLLTRRDGVAWIQATVRDANDCGKLLDAYGKRFDEKTQVWLKDMCEQTKAIQADLEASTLAILPKSFPKGMEYFSSYWKKGMHFWGTLMTAAFLSLGAPFWYNALKQLSSLRPAIAQKVEPKTSKKK